MFLDRIDAGNQLGSKLSEYNTDNALVLAIPKGGVPVGVRVALILNCDMDIIVTRKLPMPYNSETGFGAVAENGSVYLDKSVPFALDEKNVQTIIEEQKREIERRIDVLRQGRPLPDLTDRTIILVDDGIAMGSTMFASIRMCRENQAGYIIAAAPVASPRTVSALQEEADAVEVIETPSNFRAVASAYKEWHDVTDDEALDCMRRYAEKRPS